MATYKTRPEYVRAERFDWEDGDDAPYIEGVSYRKRRDDGSPYVETAFVVSSLGHQDLERGDWVVTDEDGGYHAYDDESFRAVFEPAHEGEALDPLDFPDSGEDDGGDE